MAQEVRVITGVSPGRIELKDLKDAAGNPVTFTVPEGRSELILQAVDPSAPRVFDANSRWDLLEFWAWILALLIIGAFAVGILISLARGKMRAAEMISEDGKASLSRFQALLFTFVFVIALALMVLRTGTFPNVPWEILALLAGSLGTYLAAKYMNIGSGAGAGRVDQQPTGPMIRYGTGAKTVLPSTPDTLPAQMPSRFVIPAGANTFGPLVAVATAVGGVKLRIEGALSGVPNLQGKVRYRKADGTIVDELFENSVIVETDPKAMSEVSVQWKAPTEAEVVVTNVTQQ